MPQLNGTDFWTEKKDFRAKKESSFLNLKETFAVLKDIDVLEKELQQCLRWKELVF
jgi:hypothetical protein